MLVTDIFLLTSLSHIRWILIFYSGNLIIFLISRSHTLNISVSMKYPAKRLKVYSSFNIRSNTKLFANIKKRFNFEYLGALFS